MASIGNILRRERERQKLQLSDISEETKIGIKYLKAIENDNYSVFPADIYAIGFIRNYARVLNINANELIAQYKASKNLIEPKSPIIQKEIPVSPKSKQSPPKAKKEEEKVEKTESSTSSKIKIDLEKLKTINPLPFLIGLGIIVLLVLIIVIVKNIKPTSEENKMIQFTEMKLLQFEDDTLTYDLNFNEYYKVLLGRDYHSMMVEKAIAEKEETSSDISDVILHFDKSIIQLSTVASKNIDFDSDGILDLELKLNSISLDKFNLTIRQLHTFATNTETSIDVTKTNKRPQKEEGFKIGEKGKIVFTGIVKEKNYIIVFIDGKQEEPKIYNPGAKIRFEANDVMQLKIANPAGIQAEINGQAKKLGSRGSGPANKIIKWERDPNDETMYRLVIKDYQ